MLIQFILLAGFFGLFWMTWRRRHTGAISLAEAVFWSLLWAGGALITAIPKISERMAALVGVGRGADLVLYTAVLFQFFLIFRLFIRQERMERHLTVLAEREALASFERESHDSVH